MEKTARREDRARIKITLFNFSFAQLTLTSRRGALVSFSIAIKSYSRDSCPSPPRTELPCARGDESRFPPHPGKLTRTIGEDHGHLHRDRSGGFYFNERRPVLSATAVHGLKGARLIWVIRAVTAAEYTRAESRVSSRPGKVITLYAGGRLR